MRREVVLSELLEECENTSVQLRVEPNDHELPMCLNIGEVCNGEEWAHSVWCREKDIKLLVKLLNAGLREYKAAKP